MRVELSRRLFTFVLLLAFAIPEAVYAGASIAVPGAGESKKIDAIKSRGELKAAAIGEFPWLPENTSGSGPQFSGPAWMLAEEFASRLGVKLKVVPVSHETKVPILATGEADISIAPLAVTDARKKVVDFVIYSKYSVCLFGRSDNPKLKAAKSVDDLNRGDITMAYFTGHSAGDMGSCTLAQSSTARSSRVGRQCAGGRNHEPAGRHCAHRQCGMATPECLGGRACILSPRRRLSEERGAGRAGRARGR